jgi:hypothetical protein
MKKILFSLFFSAVSLSISAQRLIPVDKNGIMTDSADIRNLQAKYSIIGEFQKVSNESEDRRARVLSAENDQWGFIDQRGKEIIPAKYLSAGIFSEYGYVKVKANISVTRKVNCGQPKPCIEKEEIPFYYFVDKNGVQSSDYFENVENLEDYLIGTVNRKQSVLRKKDMQVIYRSEKDAGLYIDENTCKLSEYFIKETRPDGKKDLVNEKGIHLTNFRYDDILAYGHFYFGLVKEDGRSTWYLLNKDLEPYSKNFYTDTEFLGYNFNKGVITLQQKNDVFLINSKAEILSDKYRRIRKLGDLFEALKGNFVGIIDRKGQIILPFRYSNAEIYKNRFILLDSLNNNKRIFSTYDPRTNQLFNEYFYRPYKKYIVAGRDENLGIRDEKLKLIIPKIYTQILPLGDTGYFMAIDQHGKVGLLNDKNKAIIPFIYDSRPYKMLTFDVVPPNRNEEINDITKYWLCFNKDNESGILNYKGEIIVPFENNRMTCFSVVAVAEKGKLGLINRKRKRIPAEYDYHVLASGEIAGLHFLKKDGKLGAVNEDNQVVIPFEFEDVDEVMENLYGGRHFVFRKKFGYSIVQRDGKMFYPYDFQYEPPEMKGGIALFDGKILYDLYKNMINIYDLTQENIDPDDFK